MIQTNYIFRLFQLSNTSLIGRNLSDQLAWFDCLTDRSIDWLVDLIDLFCGNVERILFQHVHLDNHCTNHFSSWPFLDYWHQADDTSAQFPLLTSLTFHNAVLLDDTAGGSYVPRRRGRDPCWTKCGWIPSEFYLTLPPTFTVALRTRNEDKAMRSGDGRAGQYRGPVDFGAAVWPYPGEQQHDWVDKYAPLLPEQYHEWAQHEFLPYSGSGLDLRTADYATMDPLLLSLLACFILREDAIQPRPEQPPYPLVAVEADRSLYGYGRSGLRSAWEDRLENRQWRRDFGDRWCRNWPADWLFSCIHSTDWLIDWSIVLSLDWLIDWLIARLIDWLIVQTHWMGWFSSGIKCNECSYVRTNKFQCTSALLHQYFSENFLQSYGNFRVLSKIPVTYTLSQ